MILMNLAEDLKEYAKIKVSPMADKKTESKPGEKKPRTFDDIKGRAEEQAEFVRMGKDDEDVDGGEWEQDAGEGPSYIFMELESTAQFKDIDIDKMLEHTTLDDFMRGLYMTGMEQGNTPGAQQSVGFDNGNNVLGALMTG